MNDIMNELIMRKQNETEQFLLYLAELQRTTSEQDAYKVLLRADKEIQSSAFMAMLYDEMDAIYKEYVVNTSGYYAVFDDCTAPEYAHTILTDFGIRDMAFEIARADMANIPLSDAELKAEIARADIGGLIDYIESVNE